MVQVLMENFENLPEVANAKSQVPVGDFEFIAVKEEPIDWQWEPQENSSKISSTLTVKREVDEVCAEARSGHAETEHKLREGSSGACNTSTDHQRLAGASQGHALLLPSHVPVDVPDLERISKSNSPEATNSKSKVCDGVLKDFTVKEEPRDWRQQPQVSSSKVSCGLSLKKEADACSGHGETEHKSREGSHDTGNTSAVHQKTAEASQGSANLPPADASDKICCIEVRQFSKRPTCGCRCSKVKSLMVEENVEHGPETEKPFKCYYCDYASSVSISLVRHLASRHGIGNLLKCEFCDYSSPYKNSVQRHQATKHGSGRLLKCESCDYTTYQRSSYERHLSEQHGIGKLIKCVSCDHTCFTNDALKRHLASEHGIGKLFKCLSCDYTSFTNDSLKRHLASKHGIGKLLKCKFCDYYSGHSSVVTRHEASKHGAGKLLKCEVCDYSSAYLSHFKQHLASKHGIGKLLKCDLCNYTSRISGHLKRHKVRKHSSAIQV